MHGFVTFLAQYLIYIVGVALVAVGVILPSNRLRGQFVVQLILGVIVGVILLKIAAAAHSDVRPFCANHSLKPYFSHPCDSGFPSDHSIAAGLMAGLVLAYRRWVGVLLLVATALIAWSRVDANVHRPVDVVVGALLGLLAAAIGVAVGGWLWARFEERRGSRAPNARATYSHNRR